MSEYLAVSLSRPNSKVLFAVLTRHQEGVTQAEFAILTGLSTVAIRTALFELVGLYLISIVTQTDQKSLPPSGEVGNNAQYTIQEVSTVPDGLVLEKKIREELDSVVQAEPDLISRCRSADESGNNQEKLAALVAVWNEVFPDQRITQNNAKRLLDTYKSAEFIGGVLLDVQQSAKGEIQYPRAYVEAALKKAAERKDKPQAGEELTPELWNLVKIGRRQRGYD